jgi:hypothetical protein
MGIYEIGKPPIEKMARNMLNIYKNKPEVRSSELQD